MGFRRLCPVDSSSSWSARLQVRSSREHGTKHCRWPCLRIRLRLCPHIMGLFAVFHPSACLYACCLAQSGWVLLLVYLTFLFASELMNERPAYTCSNPRSCSCDTVWNKNQVSCNDNACGSNRQSTAQEINWPSSLSSSSFSSSSSSSPSSAGKAIRCPL